MPSQLELLAAISNSSLPLEKKDEFRKRLVKEGATEEYVQELRSACGSLLPAGVSTVRRESPSPPPAAGTAEKAPRRASPRKPANTSFMSPFTSLFILLIIAVAVLAGLRAFDLIVFKPEFPFIEDAYTTFRR